eukprot:1160421-Pelagomonas_calceolata.AAC.6
MQASRHIKQSESGRSGNGKTWLDTPCKMRRAGVSRHSVLAQLVFTRPKYRLRNMAPLEPHHAA